MGVIERDGVVQSLAAMGTPTRVAKYACTSFLKSKHKIRNSPGPEPPLGNMKPAASRSMTVAARIGERLEGGLERGHHRLRRWDEWIKAT